MYDLMPWRTSIMCYWYSINYKHATTHQDPTQVVIRFFNWYRYYDLYTTDVKWINNTKNAKCLDKDKLFTPAVTRISNRKMRMCIKEKVINRSDRLSFPPLLRSFPPRHSTGSKLHPIGHQRTGCRAVLPAFMFRWVNTALVPLPNLQSLASVRLGQSGVSSGVLWCVISAVSRHLWHFWCRTVTACLIGVTPAGVLTLPCGCLSPPWPLGCRPELRFPVSSSLRRSVLWGRPAQISPNGGRSLAGLHLNKLLQLQLAECATAVHALLHAVSDYPLPAGIYIQVHITVGFSTVLNW